VTIRPEPVDAALLAESQDELIARYGQDTEPGTKPTEADLAVFLVARGAGGEAVGCGALRVLDDETVELKRMYVRPAARGRGVGRALLGALEREAARLGATRVRLETGPLQPDAIGLYEAAGYRPIPCWGAYSEAPLSRCYERRL
jgi:putative acetyltransferase